MIGQSLETGRSSRIIIITLFSDGTCTNSFSDFTSLKKLCKNARSKHFAEPSRYVLIFLHPIVMRRDAHSEYCWGCSNLSVKPLFFGGDVALVAIIDFFGGHFAEKKVPSNSVKGTF